MTSPRILLHLLLALVLVANLFVPAASGATNRGGHASPAPEAAQVMAAGDPTHHGAPAPCHGAATEQVQDLPTSAATDCCDGEACTCSCLHHAPLALAAESAFPPLPHARIAELGRMVSAKSAPTAPDIRPPIA